MDSWSYRGKENCIVGNDGQHLKIDQKKKWPPSTNWKHTTNMAEVYNT